MHYYMQYSKAYIGHGTEMENAICKGQNDRTRHRSEYYGTRAIALLLCRFCAIVGEACRSSGRVHETGYRFLNDLLQILTLFMMLFQVSVFISK